MLKNKLLLTGEFKAAAAEPTSEFIMTVSGYASTGDTDRFDEIVEPSAFDNTMSTYMKFPVIMFNHSWQHTPCGKALSYRLDAKGLWIEAGIVDTELGREIKVLIEAGILKSFSIGFNVNKWEYSNDDDEPLRFTDIELIEISIVASPANTEALIEEAQAKGIQLKSIKAPSKGGGRRKGISMLEIADVKKEIEPVDKRVKDVEVKVHELGPNFEKMAQLESELKQAATGKDLAEVRTLVEKVGADFIKAKDDLEKEIKEVKSRKTIEPAFGLSIPGKLKDYMAYEPRELKAILPADQFERVHTLQKKNDDVLFVDAMLDASSRHNYGDYHKRDRIDRIKSLRIWQEVNEYAKAMDTATATEGLEWVHTAVSGQLLEDVKLKTMVAPLVEEIRMTGASMEIDTDDAATIGQLIGEKTAVKSGFDTDEETPSTGKITLSAKKCRGRYQISVELTEDSAVAIMPWARKTIVESVARAEDRAIVNGNDSGTDANLDSGITLGSKDFRKAFKGLRYYNHQTINSGTAGSVIGIEASTHNPAKHTKCRGQMGKYGLYPSSLALLTSVNGYLLRLLHPDEMAIFQTLDKYGQNAVILNGELGRVYNVPNIVSEFVYDDLDASGVYSGAGETRTVMIYFNRGMFIRGVRRDMEVLAEKDVVDDVWQLVAFKRMAFAPTFTPSSTVKSVNVIYNVDAAN